MKHLIKKQLRESLLPESIAGGEYNVFHGSPTKITKFVDEFVGGQEAFDREGPGIYFTTSEEEANRYGENVYSVILKPNILFDEVPINKVKLRPFMKKLAMMADDWEGSAQNWDEDPIRGIQTFIEDSMEYNDNEKDCILQVWIDFYRYNPVEFVRNCVSLGIDGIIVNKDYEDIKHIIVYNPSIINIK
jgi:hypothetical protein